MLTGQAPHCQNLHGAAAAVWGTPEVEQLAMSTSSSHTRQLELTCGTASCRQVHCFSTRHPGPASGVRWEPELLLLQEVRDCQAVQASSTVSPERDHEVPERPCTA